MTETTGQRPRRLEEWSGRVSFSADRWLAALPPSLEQRVRKADRDRHAELCGRYQATVQRLGELAAEIEQAEAADHEATLRAVERGAKPPAETAPKLRAEREQVERAQAALGELIPASANQLLAGLTDSDLAEARRQLADRIDAETPRLGQHLAAFDAALTAIETARGEQGWVAVLDERGYQAPWSGHARSQLDQRVTAFSTQLQAATADTIRKHRGEHVDEPEPVGRVEALAGPIVESPPRERQPAEQ